MIAQLEVSESPIFIIGCPRSGTTIFGWSLAEHSQLWTSEEGAFLFHLFGSGQVGSVMERALSQPSPSWIRANEVTQEELLAAVGVGINAMYTRKSGGLRWIDQTPLATLMVDELAAMFPGALFLHVLRDGRKVVRSMLHFLDQWGEERREEMSRYVGPWTTDFREACRTWTKHVEAAADFEARCPDRCLTVPNEALGADP